MNKVILMGRLTKNPEVRYSNSDTPMAIARYTLAVKRSRSKSNESDADFINIVAFGKNGEFTERNLIKGQMVTIAGRVHQSSWEDAEHVKHTVFEIVAEEQQIAGSKLSHSGPDSESDSDNEVAVTYIEEH